MRLRLLRTAGVCAGVLASALLLAGGCDAGPTPPRDASPSQPASGPDARARLAADAAAAKDLTGVMVYDLVAAAALNDPAAPAAPGDPAERTVMVVRATDGSWRVDVPGGALDGRADIALVRTDGRLFHCAMTAPAGTGTGCVAVDRLEAEVDPRVHRVFTDWLDVLLNRGAALAVTAATPLAGVDGDCYAVEPSAASLEPPLDAGIYCYRDDGVLTGARLGFGTLTLTSVSEQAVARVELPGPVVDGDPLPLASPPPPSPTAPSPTATPSPSGSPTAPGSP